MKRAVSVATSARKKPHRTVAAASSSGCSLHVDDVVMNMPSLEIGFVYVIVTRVETRDNSGHRDDVYFVGHELKHSANAPRTPPTADRPVCKPHPARAWTYMPDMTYNLRHYRIIASECRGRIDNIFAHVLARASDDAEVRNMLQTILQLCNAHDGGACLRVDAPFECILGNSPERAQICQSTATSWWYASRIHLPTAHYNMALRWHAWRCGLDKTVVADWHVIREYAVALFDGIAEAEARYRAEDEVDAEQWERLAEQVVASLAREVAEEALSEARHEDDDEYVDPRALFGDDDEAYAEDS